MRSLINATTHASDLYALGTEALQSTARPNAGLPGRVEACHQGRDCHVNRSGGYFSLPERRPTTYHLEASSSGNAKVTSWMAGPFPSARTTVPTVGKSIWLNPNWAPLVDQVAPVHYLGSMRCFNKSTRVPSLRASALTNFRLWTSRLHSWLQPGIIANFRSFATLKIIELVLAPGSSNQSKNECDTLSIKKGQKESRGAPCLCKACWFHGASN